MTLDSAALALLNNNALFAGMSDADIAAISKQGREISYEPGTFIFHEGDPAAMFYVLLEGTVRMTRQTTDGKQVILYLLGPGEALAAIAALSRISYPASAEAQTFVRAFGWVSQATLTAMERYPALVVNALQLVTKRYIVLQDRFRDLATRRVQQRIAGELLRLACQNGEQNGKGIVLSALLSRQDIADLTGSTLHTVSRICSAWEQAGIIETQQRQVAILAPDSLRALAEEL